MVVGEVADGAGAEFEGRCGGRGQQIQGKAGGAVTGNGQNGFLGVV